MLALDFMFLKLASKLMLFSGKTIHMTAVACWVNPAKSHHSREEKRRRGFDQPKRKAQSA